jgi:uroporphyrinogen decarboxylase
MTGYERISTALQGGMADKVPLMLHAFMPAAAEAGINMKEYRSKPESMARAHLDFSRKYGLDGILLDVDTCILADAVGVPIDYPDDAAARVKSHVPLDKLTIEPSVVRSSERVAIILEALRIMKRKAGGELFIRGNCDQMAFSLASLCYGMEDFMADLLDEDEEKNIFALLDKTLLVHLELHKMMMEAGADMTSFGDSPSGPDLISRDLFRRFSLPYHQRLHAELQKLHIRTICHICGNLDIILDDVAGIGYEGVEIDYKTNLSKAAAAFKGKSAVFGIIDPSGLFYYGNPGTMREEVRRVLDIFATAHGGKPAALVLGSGCAIPPGAPEANIRAFVDEARNYVI